MMPEHATDDQAARRNLLHLSRRNGHAVPHLGRTGVQVSSLVLGAMNFGEIGRTTQEEATAIVDAALEAGINLIDTADMDRRSTGVPPL